MLTSQKSVMKIVWPLIAALVLSAPALADTSSDDADEVNHCLSADANQEWAAMAQKHHDSDVWQRLFALRIGLCAIVQHGDLPVDRATRIFERERQRAINQVQSRQPPPPMGEL